MEELVFAIPAKLLWELLPYRVKGLISCKISDLNSVLDNGVFRKRNDVENNPGYKQIIPYAVITSDNYYYLLKRTSKQSEKRLHNKVHLGLGGHMNPNNEILHNEKYLLNELYRELDEEIIVSDNCSIITKKLIGFINDDTIEVGKFHIGVLYIFKLSNRDVKIRELDKMTAKWVSKNELFKHKSEMETWSEIVYNEVVD